jgi:hypothetical protein
MNGAADSEKTDSGSATIEANIGSARAKFSQRRSAAKSGIEAAPRLVRCARLLTIVLMLLFDLGWLSLSPAIADQFSIECGWTTSYYVTFDSDARRVVYESPGGTALKGWITAVSAHEVRFDLLRVGTLPFDLAWSENNGKLTWVGVPSDPTRQATTSNCRKTLLRPILSEYERIAPLQ